MELIECFTKKMIYMKASIKMEGLKGMGDIFGPVECFMWGFGKMEKETDKEFNIKKMDQLKNKEFGRMIN